MTDKRCLIVFDGIAWFVRELASIEHDLATDEKIYRAKTPISGPWPSAGAAAESARNWQINQRGSAMMAQIDNAEGILANLSRAIGSLAKHGLAIAKVIALEPARFDELAAIAKIELADDLTPIVAMATDVGRVIVRRSEYVENGWMRIEEMDPIS